MAGVVEVCGIWEEKVSTYNLSQGPPRQPQHIPRFPPANRISSSHNKSTPWLAPTKPVCTTAGATASHWCANCANWCYCLRMVLHVYWVLCCYCCVACVLGVLLLLLCCMSACVLGVLLLLPQNGELVAPFWGRGSLHGQSWASWRPYLIFSRAHQAASAKGPPGSCLTHLLKQVQCQLSHDQVASPSIRVDAVVVEHYALWGRGGFRVQGGKARVQGWGVYIPLPPIPYLPPFLHVTCEPPPTRPVSTPTYPLTYLCEW